MRSATGLYSAALGVGERGEQRGLAGVGHAHDAHVRHELHLQLEPALLHTLPHLAHGGRAVQPALERRVAAPAAPALCSDELACIVILGFRTARQKNGP
jgi:hypothetical protein